MFKHYPPKIEEIVSLENSTGVKLIFSTEKFVTISIKKEIQEFSQKTKTDLITINFLENKTAIQEAIESLRELALFSTRKIILLENFDKPDDNSINLLIEFFSKDANNLLIIFSSELDKRKKSFKKLMSYKENVVEITTPTQKEIEKFIITQLAPIKPEQDFLNHFTNKDFLGDLFFIQTEIEKIKLFAEQKQLATITLSSVDEIIAGMSDEKIFKIMTMLSFGKKAQAIIFLKQIITTEGEYKIYPVLLSMFFKHFKTIFYGKIMIKENKNKELSAYINTNRVYYISKNLSQIIKKYKNIKIIKALKQLSNLEKGMKGAENIPLSNMQILIERFIVEFF